MKPSATQRPRGMRTSASRGGTNKTTNGSTRATWYCGWGGAQVRGGSTLSAMIATTTTQAAFGTSRYASRTAGSSRTSTNRNGTMPGNVDRLGPMRIQVLSQALRTDFSTVVHG